MFKALFARFRVLFVGGFTNILNASLAVAKSSAGKFFNDALPIALGIVQDLEKLQLPPADKMNQAIKLLEQAAVNAGLAAAGSLVPGGSIGVSVLRAVIEMALQQHKASA